MNREANSYTFLFATVMVVIVATALAFAATTLKPAQDENIQNEKRQYILKSFGINVERDSSVSAYKKYIKAEYVFDVNGNATRNEVIDQLKENDVTTNRLSTNLTYNEPITKFFSLVASYGLNFTTNNSHRRAFDASAPNVYDQLNPEFSNNFEADQLINQFGAIFNYKKGKTVINFGTRTVIFCEQNNHVAPWSCASCVCLLDVLGTS